jgi:rhodanese-related sulfurtransferase
MAEIAQRLGELDPERETVVICRSGARSLRVAQFLEQQGFRSVANLSGGVLAWSREVDPTIPEY